MRKLVVEGGEYTAVHQELLRDLLLLCTSTYSEVSPAQRRPLLRRSITDHSCLQVRSRAQSLLASALGTFSFAYRDLVPRILQLLSPQRGAGTQHQLKVASRVLTCYMLR